VGTTVNYHVVFDASQNGSQLGIWAIIPLLALLPGLIGWAFKDSSDPKEALKGRFLLLISACGLALSLVFLVGRYGEYYQAKKALHTRDYQIVEGTVEGFVPMPPGGHSIERFKVGEKTFQYGSGWGSIVFNSEGNRGYIRNGAQVRISYLNEEILRVELRN
jgi:hypothetical protein